MDEAFISTPPASAEPQSLAATAGSTMAATGDAKGDRGGGGGGGGGGDPTEESAVPPSVVEAWATFDLTSRRETLDTQALDIASRQEASTASRKRLAEKTRVFKKELADGKTTNKQTGTLLKAYQVEIDALTQRSKSSESAFLSLYRALYDAPDPVVELRSAAAERVAAAELRDERAAASERAQNVKIYETRIADLEKALERAAQRAAEDARAAVEAKQSEWMSAQQKAIEAYELREQELLTQISNGNKSARSLKAAADRAQQLLNDARSELDDVKKSRSSENEMVVEDLEKSRQDAAALRRRCAELEAQMEGGAAGGDGVVRGEGSASTSIGHSALSAELAARDVEVSQLKDQVGALEAVLGGKDAEKSDEFAKLSANLRAKDDEITQLRHTLQQLPSVDEYDTLRRQFETLRAFQLNETDDIGARPDGSTDGAAADAQAESLEKRLLSKVKLLEGKLTRLRMQLVERDGRIQSLTKSGSALEELVADQKALISRLEDGIGAMTGDPGSARKPKSDFNSTPTAGAAAAASETSVEDAWDWGEQREAAGLQRIMKHEDPSMLDIVSGQRDRFRARTMELETENRKLVERVDKLSADMDSLKSDNVRLYGKIRFVQSYRGGGGGGGGGAGAGAVALSAAEAGLAGPEDSENSAFLGKYRKLYEDMSNPYTLFNRRERHKRMSEMSAPERLTLRAGQRAMSTKTSRLIAFFYVLALHFLVVLVLSTASMHSSCEVTTKLEHKHV